ncbi:MAG: hypothetical protein ACKVS9_14800 [Phycisphaerae bacterium]
MDRLDRELQAQTDALLRPLSSSALSPRFVEQLADAVAREARQTRIRRSLRGIFRSTSGIAAALLLVILWRSNPVTTPVVNSIDEVASSASTLEDWLTAADATTERFSRITDDHVLLLDDDGGSSVDELLERVEESLDSFDALLGA